MAVAEACRNLVCAGAEPIGLTDCLNFGSPERPEIMRQFSAAIDGLADACRALDVPIVSGNVSLYNETDGRAILPTPTIGAVGLVRDAGDVARATFPEAGLAVLLLGAAQRRAAGRIGVRRVAHRRGEGPAPAPRSRPRSEAASAHARAPARQAAPACRARTTSPTVGSPSRSPSAVRPPTTPSAMIGAEVALPGASEPLAAALFGEAPSRIVVTAQRRATWPRSSAAPPPRRSG